MPDVNTAMVTLTLTLTLGLSIGNIMFSENIREHTLLAAIEDNGCASHLDMPAPKHLQRKDTYREDMR